jgi:CheY-like chemotaxis protein
MSRSANKIENRVLSCSCDDELRGLRALILESQGSTVVSAKTSGDAVREMNGSRFDVLLLCYQYGAADFKLMFDEFRRLFPGGRIVAIEFPQTSCDGCVPDIIVSAHAPAEMVKAVTTGPN